MLLSGKQHRAFISHNCSPIYCHL